MNLEKTPYTSAWYMYEEARASIQNSGLTQTSFTMGAEFTYDGTNDRIRYTVDNSLTADSLAHREMIGNTLVQTRIVFNNTFVQFQIYTRFGMNAAFGGYGYSAIVNKSNVSFYEVNNWAYTYLTETTWNLTIGTHDFELKFKDNTIEFYLNNIKQLTHSITIVLTQNGNNEIQFTPGAGDTGSTCDIKWMRIYKDKVIQR